MLKLVTVAGHQTVLSDPHLHEDWKEVKPKLIHRPTHTHTCIHTYVHTYIHTYSITHIGLYTHTYIGLHTCIHYRHRPTFLVHTHMKLCCLASLAPDFQEIPDRWRLSGFPHPNSHSHAAPIATCAMQIFVPHTACGSEPKIGWKDSHSCEYYIADFCRMPHAVLKDS